MRVSGLASGMDTDEIIKSLMKAQRIPMDKLSQKKQLLEWKRDDYRTLNNKILEFRNAAFDMKLESSYLAKKVTSSQESIVSVTGSPAANEGQYTLNIEKLAKSASLTSGDLTGAASSTKTIGSLGLVSDTQLKITGEKGIKSINIKTGDTIEQLVTAINNESASTGVKVSYDSTMDRLFFNSSKTGETSKINLELVNGESINNILGVESKDGAQSFASKSSLVNGALVGTSVFTVNYDNIDYDFNVTNTTTVGDLVDQMNNDLNGAGINVYLNSSGKLSVYNRDTTKTVLYSDDQGSSVVNALGLDAMTVNNSITSVTGSNAKVLFNGIEAEYDSNTFSIVGMTFNAKQVSATTVDIGVSQDVDTVVDTIKKFVEKYNSLIDEVNKEVIEKRDRDYQPLTDAEREDLDDDEIKEVGRTC